MVIKNLLITVGMELLSLWFLLSAKEPTWIAKEFEYSSNIPLINFFLPISILAFIGMLFAMAISFSLHRQEGHEFIVGNKIRNLFIGLTFLFIGGAILIVYTPPEWLQMTSQALAVLFWVFVAVSYFRKKGQKNTVPTPMDPNLPDKTIAKVISWVVIGFYVAGTLFFVYSPQEGPIKILEIAWDITNVLLAFALIPALLGALLAELLFQQKRHISKNN